MVTCYLLIRDETYIQWDLSLSLNGQLCKMDTSLRWTVGTGHNGVHLRESADCTLYKITVFYNWPLYFIKEASFLKKCPVILCQIFVDISIVHSRCFLVSYDRILWLPVLLHMCSTPCFKGTHTRFLDFRFYCACQAERFIPEVLVAQSCRWIRVMRTLGTRLLPGILASPQGHL